MSAEHLRAHRPTTLHIVVAPGAGRVRLLPPRTFRDGREWVHQGQAVARVEQGAKEIDVLAPVAGRVSSVMALDGEPVIAGTPVMAIEPEAG
jgi:biotin carboxyl carrier protein